MAKDPAFLFYSQDFITGTMFMSNEQAGIYIRLLCAQHQHGGMLEKGNFEAMVGSHSIVKSKFKETDDGYYNERLMLEMEKRSKKCSNLSENAKKRWAIEKQKQSKCNAIASSKHMQSESESENEINIKDVVNIYNDKCKSLSRVTIITDKRENHFKARLKNKKCRDLSFWESYFDKVSKSDFLTGNNGNSWKASFDWLLNENNMAKVLEGQYTKEIKTENFKSTRDYLE